MQATEITFGVEFEVSMPSSNATFTVGGYHRGAQILELPDGWNAQSDASIQSMPGFVGVEIVSPVLKGVDGIKQVIQACEWLASKGAVVNHSTGFHVHVGFDKTNEKALKRLVATVANHEQAIFATTGSPDRATNGYCRSVLRSEEAKFVHKNGLPASISRYSLLNLANLASGNKPTVEFRAFAGTVDACAAIGYIRLVVRRIRRASDR